MLAKVVSVVAAIIAGGALAVSVTHAGPQGRAGTNGTTKVVTMTRSTPQQTLGFCAAVTDNSSTGAAYVQSVFIEQPSIVGGVVTCTSGTFIPVTAARNATGFAG
jgi:hypothetical protein